MDPHDREYNGSIYAMAQTYGLGERLQYSWDQESSKREDVDRFTIEACRAEAEAYRQVSSAMMDRTIDASGAIDRYEQAERQRLNAVFCLSVDRQKSINLLRRVLKQAGQA